MDNRARQALISYLLALADDELILGHRASEWCGHAPIIEEDIAFANLALDEIGHARQWYALVGDLSEKDPEQYPDELVYHRPPSEFRNAPVLELPNGDWAFSMLRQYLFDSAEETRLESLSQSTFSPMAETAIKIRKEERYHIRHTRAWVERLGLGTEESQNRLQSALNQLWEPAQEVFSEMPGEQILVEAGIVPSSQQLLNRWETEVSEFLANCGLQIPEIQGSKAYTRFQHTAHLEVLLAELQSLPELDPEAEW